VRSGSIEAETAMNQLNPREQACMRQNVTNKLQILINKAIIKKERRPTYKMKQENQEKKLIYNIKKKMIQNNLIATKSDKGNTLVIIHQDKYIKKITYFISSNNFERTTEDLTNTQQKAIRGAINTCNNTIKHTKNGNT
jgi:hypothetical protein